MNRRSYKKQIAESERNRRPGVWKDISTNVRVGLYLGFFVSPYFFEYSLIPSLLSIDFYSLLPFPFRQVGVRPIEFQAVPGQEAGALRGKIMRRIPFLGPGGHSARTTSSG